MNQKIFLITLVIFLIIIIPTSHAQLSIGGAANQKSIEVKLDRSDIVNVKHVITSSNSPVTVNLFEGEISNLVVTDEDGNDLLKDGLSAGIADDGYGNQSIMIFPSKQNSIIKYNLENASTLYDNMWTVRIGYSETFSVLFSEDIETIFLNNNIIQLENNKGILVNDGGSIILQYNSEISKLIEEVVWEENKFNVEIITDIKIKDFNFKQESKSITFEINEKNKFLIINMNKELLGGPYVILLNGEQILFSQYNLNENDISLSIKPDSTGQITIIGTTVIPEFSMFLPLIMGFLVVLTVPFMKKFSLH